MDTSNSIGREIIGEVENKLAVLPSGGKSVRTALVYAGSLSPAVEQEGFFDFIVPIERLWE
jgi:hypothetical protein